MPLPQQHVRRFTETFIRTNLTRARYVAWAKKMKMNPQCGLHVWFCMETLGIPRKDFSEYQLVSENNITRLLQRLDRGYVLKFYHNYNTPMIVNRLGKRNRYVNHEWVVVKGGDKYFMLQGFLGVYLHSCRSYSRNELQTMLSDIVCKMSDYDNTRKWKDVDASLFRQYFGAPPLAIDFKTDQTYPVVPTGKMHNIVLKVDIH